LKAEKPEHTSDNKTQHIF